MTELEDLVGKQKRVVSISNHVTVRDAAKAMAEANVGAAAIMDGTKLVGLFTERDVLKRVLLRNLDVDEVLVRDVMTRDLICAELGHNTNDARFLLKRHHIRHLPVLDKEGNLAGVLSIRDLIKDEVREMRDYIAQAEG
ncbi:MAG: CBS domain-containing protein [Planctomycetota bacterium]|jgi:CBS domain-containing protein|nr:CBS domain-containing protein [Planctomycetota bacterium]